MRRAILLAALFAMALGCDASGTPLSVVQAAPVPGPVRTLRIVMDSRDLIEGALGHALIKAYDPNGMSLATDRVQIVSSNLAVTTIGPSELLVARDPSTGRSWREQSVSLLLIAPGVATVRVMLDGVTDTLQLSVQPRRVSNSALVVESFAVHEFRATCAWACPYLVYAPQLVLREPTGGRTVEVEDVQFTVGTHTTGVCRGRVVFTPGRRAEVNPIDAYLWANDLIFVSLDGTPFPGEVATARVTIRDAGGTRTVLETFGGVQRMSTQPGWPLASFDTYGWSCR